MWRIAVIAVAGVLAYANALRTPFIYDDSIAIVDNAHIRTLQLPDALFSARENPTAGRPLVNFSFALNYAAGELNPFGYHLVNIGIHVLCALTLFAIARRALASDNLGLAVALLWTVHPLNSEAVDYVTERSESLMALFFLLTFYCAIRAAAAFAQRVSGRNEASRANPAVRRSAKASLANGAKKRSTRAERLWTAGAIAACAAGMACKETMAVAPLVVVLYDRAFVFDSWSAALRRRWPLYAGLAATWALLAVFLWSGPRVHSAGFTSGFPVWTYLLNQTVMIVRYLRLSVWPRDLVLNYGWPRALTLGDVVPQALLVLALLALTVAAATRSPRLALAGAWFFLILAPTSSIMPIATEVGAERRMYLPLVAIVTLAVVGVEAARNRLRLPAAATAALLIVSSAALMAGTRERNQEYQSSARLAATIDERWPTPVSDALVGYELGQQGRRDEALVRLRRSADGGYSTAWFNLGGMLLTGGQLDEGIEALERFLQEAPLETAAVQTHVLLGRAFLTKGDVPRAIVELQQARSMDPSNIDALGVLSDALLAARQFERAAGGYRAYLTLRPDDATATLNLGTALAEAGRLREAAAAFEHARDLNPHDPRAYKNLASLALNANDVEGGVRAAAEAVRVAPSDAEAHDLLGRALAGRAELNAARREFERALALNPSYAQARGDLQTLARAIR
jgi:tetratricopeptide (TPR) repeat protein